jgi:tetratricopeptide (TPR) repeat protein
MPSIFAGKRTSRRPISDVLRHGAVYAIRGDLEHQLADYPNALEYLSRSIRLQPRAPDVIFNRALVLERMMLKDQAILEWEAYLKLDGSTAWADEARTHLAELKALLKRREEALALIADYPQRFLALADSGKVDAELFLENIAVTKWLPRVNQDTGARVAAERLAGILKEEHGDSLLTDVLNGSLEPAAKQLASARIANEAGKPDTEFSPASEAERNFSRAGNRAGGLWARFEIVTSLRLLLRTENCFRSGKAAAGLGRSFISVAPKPSAFRIHHLCHPPWAHGRGPCTNVGAAGYRTQSDT